MFVFMLEGSYQTTSLSWRASLLTRQFREWIEYQLSKTDIDPPNLPEWSIPEIVQQVLFWGLVVALGAWLAILLYKALAPSIRNWLERTQGWTRLGDRTPSPEQEHSAQYWWQQAQAYAEQGNYKEACKALYRATLQQLHDRQILPHDASRTDGEYLAGIKQGLNSVLPRPYQLLIGTHERLVFGVADASGEVFKRCRRAYEEIQKREIQNQESQNQESQKQESQKGAK